MNNYKQMKTKKLQALLTSVEPEEAVLIQTELDSRELAEATTEEASSESITTEAEDKFIQGLEEAEEAKANIAPSTKLGKMSFAEAEELAKSLEYKVGHICKVVPFNTIEWVDGVVAAVVADKRSCKVLFAIRADDGRRMLKAYDSKMLLISDDKADVSKLARKTKSTTPAVKLDEEALQELTDSLKINVGRYVTFKPTNTYFVVRESDGAIVDLETMTGIIMALVPDKRSGRVLYRIECNFLAHDPDAPANEDGSEPTKPTKVIVHKVSAGSDLVMGDYDETIRAKYEARVEAPRVPMTPEVKLEMLRIKLEKILEQIITLNSRYSTNLATYEDLAREIEAANAAIPELK